jgi:hypothetical protein
MDDGKVLDSDTAVPLNGIDPEASQPAEQENPSFLKEKSSFQNALTRGKEKSEAYKAQKPQEPATDRKPREERS